MSAKERLQVVQLALKERGVEDVKFFFAGTSDMPMSHVVSDVADALQAFLDGRVRALYMAGEHGQR